MVYRPFTVPRRRIPTVREARVGTRSPLSRFLALGPSSWYDARDVLTSDQQTLVNRVGVGTATFGSTSGSDFNDPVRLPHDGTNYIWDPRVAGNSIQAALDTGCSTASTTVVTLLRKSLNSPSGKWLFVHTGPANTGRFNLLANNTGPGVILALTRDVDAGVHTITMPLANALSVDHLRVTIEWDALGPGLARTTLEHSNDPIGSTITWTATAPVDTGGVAVRRPEGAGTFTIGHPSAAANGDALYRLSIANDGSAPTVLFDAADATDQTGSVLVSGGTSWNIVRFTSGLRTTVVTRPVMVFDDTDDFLQLPTSDIPNVTHLSGGFTVGVVHRRWGGAGPTASLWSAGNGRFEGLCLYESSGTTLAATARDSGAGGVNNFLPSTLEIIQTKFLVISNGAIAPHIGGNAPDTPLDTTGLSDLSLSTTSGPRINSSSAESSNDVRGCEYFAVVQWPRALTTQEMDDASAFLLGPYA